MSEGPEKRRGRLTNSWHNFRVGTKPESPGGLISLYIAVVAAIAVYYMFR